MARFLGARRAPVVVMLDGLTVAVWDLATAERIGAQFARLGRVTLPR